MSTNSIAGIMPRNDQELCGAPTGPLTQEQPAMELKFLKWFGCGGRHGWRHSIFCAARRPDAVRPRQFCLRQHHRGRLGHLDACCDHRRRCLDGCRRDDRGRGESYGSGQLRRHDEHRCDEFLRFICRLGFTGVGSADLSARPFPGSPAGRRLASRPPPRRPRSEPAQTYSAPTPPANAGTPGTTGAGTAAAAAATITSPAAVVTSTTGTGVGTTAGTTPVTSATATATAGAGVSNRAIAHYGRDSVISELKTLISDLSNGQGGGTTSAAGGASNSLSTALSNLATAFGKLVSDLGGSTSVAPVAAAPTASD